MKKHDFGFVGRPERAADDPAVVPRAAGRRAVAESRDRRLAERRAEVQAQREASTADRQQRETELQAEQKVQRDAASKSGNG